MADIDSLQIKITSDSTKASSEIDKLSNSLAALGRASGSGSGLKKAADETSRLKKELGGITLNPIKNILGSVGISISLRQVSNAISQTIKKSTEYIENLNLFNVAMGSFASEARAYANEVSEIMGIDPSEWMRAQGVFMTLGTGFGVAADKASLMSKNLTQLGYDISSFFNISVEDAMQKLQSGISGELEPLRRLGYDLSQARLEATALSLGIDKSVSSMTQAEKAQLRYVAIMSQVTQVQGDMARTLDDPANQLRIFSATLNQTARSIGNIFIPALNKILPYAIAVVKVVGWVANSIASLFGLEIASEVEYPSIDNFVAGAGEAEEALGGAAGAAKELKRQVMGFDELNILNDPNTGGGGGGGAVGGGGSEFDFELPTYDFLGDAVAGKAEQVFEDIKGWIVGIIDEIPADTIKSVSDSIVALKEAWKGIKSNKNAQKIIDFVEGLIAVGADIFLQNFATAVDFLAQSLKTIDGILSGDFNKAGEGLLGAFNAFDEYQSTPFSVLAEKGFDGFYKMIWGEEQDIPEWAKETRNFFTEVLAPSANPLSGGLFVNAITYALPYAREKFEELRNDIENIFSDFDGWFKKNVSTPVLEVFEKTKKGISEKMSRAWEEVKLFWEDPRGWFDSNVRQPVSESFGKLASSVVVFMGQMWDGTVENWKGAHGWFSENVFEPLENKAQETKERIGQAFINAWRIVEETWQFVSEWFEVNIRQPIVNVFNRIIAPITTAFSTAWASVRGVWDSVVYWFKQNVIWPMESLFSNMSFDIRVPRLYVYWDSDISTAIGKAANFLFGRYAIPKIGVTWDYYADGGYGIPEGQLFIANESGPELVGQMNGRNAVANQAQIIEGIRQATYEGFMSAMAAAGNGQGNQHITVQVGDETLADVVVNAVNKQTRELGYLALEGI